MTKFVSKAKLTYILAKVKALIAARVITWSEITGKPSTYTPSSHTHSYAGSSTAGGAATSANKLNTNAGSQTQPVYFVNGIPTVCTYTLSKSVPSDAKFTDTVYTHPSSHPASMINVTIGTSTVALSDVIACAVFPISQGDGYVEFGNITEWLAANKPKL